jgi:hypothetical protein
MKQKVSYIEETTVLPKALFAILQLDTYNLWLPGKNSLKLHAVEVRGGKVR